MSFPNPGRLRPWVRFGVDGEVWQGRPNPELSLAEWTEILWDACFFLHNGPLPKNLTALTRASGQDFWLGWMGETLVGSPPGPTRRQPVAAALVWGQVRSRSPVPWRELSRWAGMSRRRLWPLGLLYEMAVQGFYANLLEPPAHLPARSGQLAALAAIWFGAETGVAVWNSFCLGRADDQYLRWQLALIDPCVVPPQGTPAKGLDGLARVLVDSRREFVGEWPLLLTVDFNGSLPEAWRQDYPLELLRRVTREMDDNLAEVLAGAPARVGEFLALADRWRPFQQSLPWDRMGELFLVHSDLDLVLLILLCMALRASPARVIQAAELHPAGQALSTAFERWQAGGYTEDPEVARLAAELQVSEEKLSRLRDWRRLGGQRQAWPKPLRGWMKRYRTSPDNEIRQLLKLQQGLETSLAEAGRQAWGKLLDDALVKLLSQLLDCPNIQPEYLPAAWLLANPKTNREQLRFFLAGLKWKNWRHPAQLRREVWEAGLSLKVRWRNEDFHLKTADALETLQMGTDFNTCLSLRDGQYSSSLLTNALDLNKQVLYLRNGRGQPVLRQLVAVNQTGRLVTYPVYSHRGDDEELLKWWDQQVEEYAGRCGLARALEEGEVLTGMTDDQYYCDAPARPTPPPDCEDDYCRQPTRLDKNCHWRDARWLNYLLHEPQPFAEFPRYLAQRLAEVGQTRWLRFFRSARLPVEYLHHLDYAADPEPLADYLERYRPTVSRLKRLPVALVALPFDRLLSCLKSLAPGRLWPEPGLGEQALALLVLSWRHAPDFGSLWHHLRHSEELQPLLWRLASWVEIEGLESLLVQGGRGGWPYSRFLAAARHGWKLPQLRRRAQRLPWSVPAQAALLHSPDPDDVRYARDHADQHEHSWLTFADVAAEFGRAEFEKPGQDPEKWVFSGSERGWRVYLLARLHRDGRLPQLSGAQLLEWCLLSDCTWAARDLMDDFHLPTDTELCHALRRPLSRQQAWRYIETMSESQRCHFLKTALYQVTPEDWMRLASWIPDDPGEANCECFERTLRLSRRFAEWQARAIAGCRGLKP